MTFRYCKKCILPDTRPNLVIDSKGNCNCAASVKNKPVDWNARASMFREIVKSTKRLNRPYDCLIPVSGGKDSTWQLITALEAGLKPLCVTWRTPARNSLGQKNLDNLITIGTDHIDISINPNTERLFTLRSFEKYGSPVIPMHMAIHALPMNVALEKKIPLILWGENAASEYGGDAEDKGMEITRNWLKKYGVTHGTVAEDWVDEKLSLSDLSIYAWPDENALKTESIRAVFLGEYFKWDPRDTAEIAKQHGFQEADQASVGQFKFADIDDAFLMAIHHWMKWYKFGITRTWDNLSLDIRSGKISREQAILEVSKIGGETPHVEIEAFCKYVKISKKRFFEIAETFRNTEIWSKKDGVWKIDDFLIPNLDWISYETS